VLAAPSSLFAPSSFRIPELAAVMQTLTESDESLRGTNPSAATPPAPVFEDVLCTDVISMTTAPEKLDSVQEDLIPASVVQQSENDAIDGGHYTLEGSAEAGFVANTEEWTGELGCDSVHPIKENTVPFLAAADTREEGGGIDEMQEETCSPLYEAVIEEEADDEAYTDSAEPVLAHVNEPVSVSFDSKETEGELDVTSETDASTEGKSLWEDTPTEADQRAIEGMRDEVQPSLESSLMDDMARAHAAECPEDDYSMDGSDRPKATEEAASDITDERSEKDDEEDSENENADDSVDSDYGRSTPDRAVDEASSLVGMAAHDGQEDPVLDALVNAYCDATGLAPVVPEDSPSMPITTPTEPVTPLATDNQRSTMDVLAALGGSVPMPHAQPTTIARGPLSNIQGIPVTVPGLGTLLLPLLSFPDATTAASPASVSAPAPASPPRVPSLASYSALLGSALPAATVAALSAAPAPAPAPASAGSVELSPEQQGAQSAERTSGSGGRGSVVSQGSLGSTGNAPSSGSGSSGRGRTAGMLSSVGDTAVPAAFRRAHDPAKYARLLRQAATGSPEGKEL
jgi:hypothetical protein